MTLQGLSARTVTVGGLVSSAGHRANVILAAVILLNLVPIWAFTYFPSLDGPAHVSLTWWMVHYNDLDLPSLRVFFESNLQFIPNYLIFLILYPLMHVFPAIIAEKLLISLYAIILPLALRYCLTGAAPEARGLAVIGCAMTFHALLLLGFYNTSFALPIFLLGIGFWLRCRHRIGVTTLAGYAGIGALAYVTHLSAVATCCLAIFFATVGLVLGDLRNRGLSAAWQRLASHGLWPALGFAPAILLCLAFMLRGGGEVAADGVAGFSLPDLSRILSLLMLDSFIGHDARERFVAIGLALTLYLSVRTLVRRGAKWLNPGLAIAVGFTLLYLSVPYGFDVRWMPTRLMPYVVFGLLIWIAGVMAGIPEQRRLRTTGIVVLCASIVTIAGTGLRLDRWAEINALLTEYNSANHLIEADSTLLGLRLPHQVEARGPSDRIDLMLQMPGYIAVQRDVVDLKHFQAYARAFPLAFRRDLDPYRHLASDAQFVGFPETIRPTDYHAATGHTVDYVLLWGDESALRSDSPLAVDLAAHYDLIHVSEPRGAMRLFQLAD